jgi:hypothetical protein
MGLISRIKGFFQKEQKIEIFISTNTLYPYHRHNITILSLPAGITYRFRYEARHFAIDDIKGLVGKLGLLVLRDFVEATFIPLRTFRVFRVEHFGNFIFLELEFLHLVKYDLPPVNKQEGEALETFLGREKAELKRVRERHSGVIVAGLPRVEKIVGGRPQTVVIENRPNEGLEKLIFPVGATNIQSIAVDSGSNEEETLRYWSNTVALLGGIDYYAGACFYRIASVKEVDSDKSFKLFEGKKRKGVLLYTDKTYVMQIFQLMGSKKAPAPPGFKIEFKNIQQHILPIRDSEAVDGEYDKLEFIFYVLPQPTRRVNSYLIITNTQQLTNPKEPAPPGVIQELAQVLTAQNRPTVASLAQEFDKLLAPPKEKSTLDIPPSLLQLKIKWTFWQLLYKRVLPYLAVVVATVLYLASKEISAWLGQKIGQEVKPELVQFVALFLGALAAGSLTTYAGAFKPQSGSGPKT